MKPPSITILKPGTFTDVRGTEVTFTPRDLAEIAESYDPASEPAPLVIGHPPSNGPAHGWVGALRVEGGRLIATPSSILPAFAKAVRDGRYRKVSPELYPPRAPKNPSPGRWGLRHVGFLGAAAPAIKGLGTVAFADGRAAVTLASDVEIAGTPVSGRRFAMPPGYTAPAASIELAERVLAVRAEFPHLSSDDALQLARDELGLETLALGEGECATARERALSARVRRLRAADPTLSYWSAFQRAR